MQITESILSAVKSVYSYKMRSLLTMLGIIIGISSVIMITSIGDGVYNAIYDEMGAFNTTAIQVFPRSMIGPPILTIDDMESLRAVHNVENVAGVLDLNGQELQLRNPNETRRGTGNGIDHNYHIMEDVSMLYGRFITEQDVLSSARVAVIRPEISLEVFGFVNSVGQSLQIEGANGRYNLTVVGVLDIEPNNIGAQTPLNMGLFLLPTTTAGELSNRPNRLNGILVSIENPALSVGTSEQITRLLNIRHGLDNGFAAMSMSTVMDWISVIFAGVTGFIAFVAGISLFVGGVGVMNIMMVTVTERTKEIGIRKSLGATGFIIRMQFVFESVLITSIGGIIGIIFGLLSAAGLTAVVSAISPMAIVASVDTTAITIAVIVSMLVGIVFGVYPAAKAANLDPVDSLRYE